ncbi:unnamed protein product, partial [Urochloa humidicola]
PKYFVKNDPFFFFSPSLFSSHLPTSLFPQAASKRRRMAWRTGAAGSCSPGRHRWPDPAPLAGAAARPAALAPCVGAASGVQAADPTMADGRGLLLSSGTDRRHQHRGPAATRRMRREGGGGGGGGARTGGGRRWQLVSAAVRKTRCGRRREVASMAARLVQRVLARDP